MQPAALASPPATAPAEAGGTAQSSPSKAGSLAPLLLGGPGNRSSLFKFPSGVSGVSSHDNPMFDEGSEEMPVGFAAGGSALGGTQQSVLPQHLGSWELQSRLLTQQAFAQAQRAAAEAAAQQAQQQQGQAAPTEEGWRPNVLAMIEHKGATGGCRWL